MPVVANLIFTQGVSGSAGKYFVGVIEATVTLSNEVNTDVTNWKYELLDVPDRSSLVAGTLSDGGSPTATFTPDVSGGAYRVKLTVTGPINTSEFTGTFFVPTDWFSWLLPAYLSEAAECFPPRSSVNKGWMSLLNGMFLQVDAALGPFSSTGSGSAHQHLESNGTSWVPADDLVLPSPVGESTTRYIYVSDTVAGGNLQIESGMSSASRAAGDIYMSAPSGNSNDPSPTSGGNFTVSTGNGGSSAAGNVYGGSGGAVAVYCGTGGDSAGNKQGGDGGDLTLWAGSGGACYGSGDGGQAGNISLVAGAGGDSSAGTIANGGDVILSPGSTNSATASKAGKIVLTEPNADGIGAGLLIEVNTGAVTKPALQVTTGGVWQARNEGGAFGNILTGSASGSIIGCGAYSSMPAAGTAGNMYFATDSPTVQWVDDGAAFRPIINGAAIGTKPPLASSFTIRNSPGSASITDVAGTLTCYTPTSTGVVSFVVPQTGNTMYCEIVFESLWPQMYSTVCSPPSGLCFRETSTNKIANFMIATASSDTASGTGAVLSLRKFSNDTTYVSETSSAFRWGQPQNNLFAMRMRRSTGNFYAEFSRDLITWVGINATFVITDFFTTAPDELGVCLQGANMTNTVIVKHFKYGTL